MQAQNVEQQNAHYVLEYQLKSDVKLYYVVYCVAFLEPCFLSFK